MENGFEEETHEVNKKLSCSNCGGTLNFKPGVNKLVCQFCRTENEIVQEEAVIEEIDFFEFLEKKFDLEEKMDVITVRCKSCGATTTLKPNITSDQCPYCASPLVVSDGSTSSLLKPKSLLPFVIEQKKAVEEFRKWVKGLWFAPSKLQKQATSTDKLKGLYIPYWTYDSKTTSQYSGERGDYYYVTETYTTTENGQSVTKTREVRKIRWTFVSGTVYSSFDDILILASNSLPEKYTNKLEPWDTQNLVPFNEMYLSGFQAESYQVDLKQGFEKAKSIMETVIRDAARHDIGGDEQRVDTLSTIYDDVTFKHILLPIWLSSYRYSNKVYRFLVNGRTGEVQGERPYSAVKIALAILGGLAIIAVGIFSYMHFK